MPSFKYGSGESRNPAGTGPDDEATPLISTSSNSNSQESETGTTFQYIPSLHNRNTTISSSRPFSSPPNTYFRDITFHSTDESGNLFLEFIMEKVKNTKIAYWSDRLAVESEPGLTNAQLMLNNHDLKPGELSLLSAKAQR